MARPSSGPAGALRRALVVVALARFGDGLQGVRRRVHFINLTNGIEVLSEPAFAGGLRGNVNFVRIQSSRCEANDFYGVLGDLDHNLLFHLATGAECVVYDYGSRGTAWPGTDVDVKIPRAIWWGLEWIRYALRKTWKLDDDPNPPTLRGYNVKQLFDEKLARLPKPLYKKLKYYRKFAPTAVDLVGAYGVVGTTLDGKDDVYASIVDGWVADAGAADADDDNDDDALPASFRLYRAADYAGVGRGACAKKGPAEAS